MTHPPDAKPERFGDVFYAAWTGKDGKPQRRIITRLEWQALGGVYQY